MTSRAQQALRLNLETNRERTKILQSTLTASLFTDCPAKWGKCSNRSYHAVVAVPQESCLRSTITRSPQKGCRRGETSLRLNLETNREHG